MPVCLPIYMIYLITSSIHPPTHPPTHLSTHPCTGAVCGEWWDPCAPLHWRHNDHDGVSNHQPRGCLFNRLFRCRSKKTSKLRVTGLCAGNSSGPVNSPHKGPVTRKMFPFDDVIMLRLIYVSINFTKKTPSYWYRESHYKPKMAVRPVSHIGEATSI